MLRRGCHRGIAVALLINFLLVLLFYHRFFTTFVRRKPIAALGTGFFSESRFAVSLNASPAWNTTRQGPPPLILLGTEHWARTPYWGRTWHPARNSDFGANGSIYHLSACPNICGFTFNWTLFRGRADLVIMPTFYYETEAAVRDLNQSAILPWQETAEGQLWLGLTVETPLIQGNRGKKIDGVFHWIGNYRRDADVRFSYGHIQKLNKSTTMTHPTKAKSRSQTTKKKKLVAWLVSNCKPRSKRDVVVKTLQKFIPVDIYGKCGPRKCPDEGDCRKYLANNYKFYLAFENSLCIDYVTEKLYANLKLDILPITYSWINDFNGSRTAPPNSYINALDFGSIKDLAEYLIYLDQNEDEYQKYFQWKDEYKIVSKEGLCLACEKLVEHRRAIETSRIPRHVSMLGWMNSLPQNGSGNAELRVGGHSIISTTSCISDPMNNKILKNWILGST